MKNPILHQFVNARLSLHLLANATVLSQRENEVTWKETHCGQVVTYSVKDMSDVENEFILAFKYTHNGSVVGSVDRVAASTVDELYSQFLSQRNAVSNSLRRSLGSSADEPYIQMSGRLDTKKLNPDSEDMLAHVFKQHNTRVSDDADTKQPDGMSAMQANITAKMSALASASAIPAVKIKLLHPDAVMPKYESAGAAGLDLTAVSFEPVKRASVAYLCKVYGKSSVAEFELENMLLYRTGIAVEIPRGYVGLLIPRSSVATKTDLSLANSVGVIDSDYRGEIMAVFRINGYNVPEHQDEHGGDAFTPYGAGERCCQLVIVPCPQVKLEQVDALGDTVRGDGGFGSTGQ